MFKRVRRFSSPVCHSILFIFFFVSSKVKNAKSHCDWTGCAFFLLNLIACFMWILSNENWNRMLDQFMNSKWIELDNKFWNILFTCFEIAPMTTTSTNYKFAMLDECFFLAFFFFFCMCVGARGSTKAARQINDEHHIKQLQRTWACDKIILLQNEIGKALVLYVKA